MSAVEELREAARTMRERAQAATPSADPDPGGWLGFSMDDGRSQMFAGPAEQGYRTGSVFRFVDYTDCEECTRPTQADVDHIASWHPAVALAVADWLDVTADMHERGPVLPRLTEALAVARAYLGRTDG